MTSGTQLSLFDPASTRSAPSYKIGDWVRLLKKPKAFGYRRGEVVQIENIHPSNGTVKFWNDRSERWDYLEPEEFRVAIGLEIPLDSVSPQSVEVDTESIPNSQFPNADRGKIDSVSGSTGDTESKAVSAYRPRGSARGGEYFRYSYRASGRMRHVHIPGGNTGSAIAQSRAIEVRSKIAAGMRPIEIVEMIRSW